MEERDQPSSSKEAISHEPPRLDHDPDPDPHPDPLRPNEPREVFPMGTYVVQVPKDQVYRVPPPENALIIKRYHSPIAKSKMSCCCCFFYLFLIFITALIVLGILASITSIFIRTKNPVFCIDQFLVKSTARSSQGNAAGHEFDIRTKAKNPNERSGILYKEGGKSSLLFERREVAAGKFPTFYQSEKNTTASQLVLHDSSDGSSKEIEESMKGAKSMPKLALSLSIKVPARMTVGLFRKQDVDLVVSCNFEVDTLAEGTRILSQQCRAEH